MTAVDRRTVLKSLGAAGALGLSAASAKRLMAKDSPNERIRLGVMGCRGSGCRGQSLARGFAALPNAEVAYLAEVDQRNIAKSVGLVAGKQSTKPKVISDFRKILDDKSIDALVVAAPDHWHSPAAILACDAGKHVYCEKPCSHNPQEGAWLVQAARKHKRVVQHGTQRRTWPAIREAMAKLHAGEIGTVLSSRSWYFNDRPSIGKGKKTATPDWLKWDTWQGPAPRSDFRNNLVHYKWHWFWHWGTGEVGNNGVHFIDLCRWGLGVDYASRVVSEGSRLRYSDDQQTPDTNTCTFRFRTGDREKMIIWEGRSWGGRRAIDPPYDVAFFGEKGTLYIKGAAYKIVMGRKSEVAADGKSAGGDADHLKNFLAAIKGDAKANAEIEEGHKSALLCHLANIAYRTGGAVNCNAKTGEAIDSGAKRLWQREYAPKWESELKSAATG